MRSGEAENSENFGAIGEALSGLAADIEGSDRAPTQPQRDVLATANGRLDRAAKRWDRVEAVELVALNAQAKAAGHQQIVVPAPEQITLDRAPESKDLP